MRKQLVYFTPQAVPCCYDAVILRPCYGLAGMFGMVKILYRDRGGCYTTGAHLSSLSRR